MMFSKCQESVRTSPFSLTLIDALSGNHNACFPNPQLCGLRIIQKVMIKFFHSNLYAYLYSDRSWPKIARTQENIFFFYTGINWHSLVVESFLENMPLDVIFK